MDKKNDIVNKQIKSLQASTKLSAGHFDSILLLELRMNWNDGDTSRLLSIESVDWLRISRRNYLQKLVMLKWYNMLFQ